MNKTLLIILLAIIPVLLYSCKKSSTNTTTTDATNQWTFMGTTYNGAIGQVDTFFHTFEESDKVGNLLTITFNVFPKASGVYTVIKGDTSSPSNISTGCTILVSNQGDTSYVSTGKTGDIVNVTITGGTIKASFSNISVIENQLNPLTTTVSGVMTQPIE